MNEFRNAVIALKGKQTYVLFGEMTVKVTIKKVVGDMVILSLDTPLNGANELAMHIESIQLVMS